MSNQSFMDIGRLLEPEFKECAIDNFEKHNYDANFFFLSHCHTDHMKGLSEFDGHLKSNDVYIFCSELSKRFLLNKFRQFPEEKIVVLEKGPNEITGQHGTFTVIPLRAGHCPGSLMFLFLSGETAVLFTGDFRLTPKDLAGVRELYDIDNELIKLDTLYLDTTFAHISHDSFPTREESFKCISEYVKWWLNIHHENKVVLSPPGNIGIEYLLVELSKAFNTRIHIVHSLFLNYHVHITALRDYVTADPDNMRIHMCKGFKRNCDDCKSIPDERVMVVRPSAQYFSGDILSTVGPCSYENKFLRVAYSSHCSYKELCEVVLFFKPRKIVPLVYNRTEDEIVRCLEAVIRVSTPKKVKEPDSPFKNIIVRPTKEEARLLKEKQASFYKRMGLESPPLRTKHKKLDIL